MTVKQIARYTALAKRYSEIVLASPQGDPNLCSVDGAVIPAAQQRGLCAGGGTPGAERYRPVRGK